MRSRRDTGMPNSHLHELFVDELKDILGAEKQLLNGLKKMADTAINPNLKDAFLAHKAETEEHIDRLNRVFAAIDVSPRAKKCKAMEGLLNEAEEIMSEFEGHEALDAALIAAAQKVEHYEIASYGCLITYASLMKHEEVKALLEVTLNEEKETDVKLTDIAMSEANVVV
jgi:ferritin-like metal-binding protein YciE